MAYPIHVLLAETLKRKGSDLHLSVGIPAAIRMDGTLNFIGEPITSMEHLEMLSAILSPSQMETLQKDKELDFSFTFHASEELNSRFRGNCAYERGNLCTALRVITSNIRTTKQLMLSPTIEEIANRMRGLFLVTGPTGSGKSTTLAAIIQQINMTRYCHIITIEDPIEYLYFSERSIIHQREIGSDTKSFSEALKRALRQDPDVILIGEMRDLETVSAAVTAAETGHLVFGTLHTPDAAQTIDRIIDVFPPHQQDQIRIQIANILVGVCSQQLLPLPGGGRMVATELLIANPAVRNCVREAKTSQIKGIMQTGAAMGMHTMDQDLARLVSEGYITRADAFVYSYDVKELERLLG
ncbi:MAG: type IV pilus twitching motility protein PilT [Synergistaceae bacterium]|jgi:twitching motility protein PilT|nr:type IV pilus twitching motility protein PilT [Synergistaceae bacterium]